MNKEQYAQTQHTILTLAEIVRDLPLSEFLQAIRRADAIGPIVDPSLWIKGQEKMHEIERMAEGLRRFQFAIPQIKEEHDAG